MYIMLNRISKTVAYATLLVLQISTVNLGNYIHVADYPNEHNISYAEIRSLLDLRASKLTQICVAMTLI